MPLYDCMLLLKPHVNKEAMMDLALKVGKHVYRRNGVVTNVKASGEVQLGYGIKKLDGKYFQGQLMQMTMMTPPSFSSELHYLNKEDRLLRWLLVKNRDAKLGRESFKSFDGDDNPLTDWVTFGKKTSDDDEVTEDDDDDDDSGFQIENFQFTEGK